MQQPGWEEPPGASNGPPGARPPVTVPGYTGVVDPAGYPQQPLPPAGWRPLATARRGSGWAPTRRELLTALGAAGVLAATGLGLAAAWVAVAPRLAFTVLAPGRAVATAPEGEQSFAADGWFTVLTLAAGVLAALLLWRVRSVRGPAALLALAVGGTAAAVLCWRFGAVLAPDPNAETLRQVGAVVHQELRLRAQSALVVEPIAAVVTYLLCTGFAARNDLGREETPPGPDPYGGR